MQEELGPPRQWLGGDWLAQQLCSTAWEAVQGAACICASSPGLKSVCTGFFPTLLLWQVLLKSRERTGSAILSTAMISSLSSLHQKH